ncbi:anionic trypsin-like isoform X1 [Phymastichus coffea]|uniref:anionic trypsin-like isoform X1 n=2 Tax=Phymastichus coffea TaxID=108790 RepID=UPI00273ABDEA|nr:anionic trypsin-like isoform X1 [Phymastichus coffea]
MIRFSAGIFLIAQLFVFMKANPLVGDHVFPADPREFPFIASIRRKFPEEQLNREHICTGALITQKHIITAAHCFRFIQIHEIDVIVAEENWTTPNFIYEIDSWVTYNAWARATGKTIEFLSNDVMIIKLSSPVNREVITPINITMWNEQQLHRTNAFMFGWNISSVNSGNIMLVKGQVTILTNCEYEHRLRLMTNEHHEITKNYLASSADPYILSSCGDSGAPLVDKDNVLLGITLGICPSVGWGNFSLEFYRQYIINLHLNVYYYREFIENAIILFGE